mmetsp:Transcript_44532/g.127567  ORF Transcript_44532/g.127567 Transcript_44532/m.127567 type:complete len:200 (-) Transcript_44532:487-1086(-)
MAAKAGEQPAKDASEGDALETIFGKLMGAAAKAGEDPTKALDSMPSSVREALAVASPEELKTLAAMSEEDLHAQFLSAAQTAQAEGDPNESYHTAVHMSSREQFPEGVSVHVGGLDGMDDILPEMLAEYFKSCGDVKRVAVKVDRWTGARLGFAIVDFGDEAAVETALTLDGSEFGGATLKVTKKKPAGDWGGKGKGKK